VVHACHVVAVDGAHRALKLYGGQQAAAGAAPPGSNQGLLAAASFDSWGAQELGGLSALRYSVLVVILFSDDEHTQDHILIFVV
jgi:hypothetical protein